MQTKPVIAIIGGGAAGMMVAASLIEQNPDAEIHLFEKNSQLGAKVIISGGGRCNVTTGISDKKLLLSKYIRGSDFLGSHTLKVFGPKKVYKRFEDHGVPLKIEDDLRVFPQSNNGKDIVAVFEEMFARYGLTVHFGEPLENVSLRYSNEECKDNCPREKKFLLVTKKSMYQADYLVITTGGNAYSHTGSSGDGYTFATACGHTVSTLGPSLNSFMTKETWCHELTGLSFPHAQLSTILADGTKKSSNGPILFTHFGLSGPATFAFSAHVSFSPISADQPLTINFNPDTTKSYDIREKEIRTLMEEHNKKEVRTVLGMILTKRFVDVLLQVAGMKPDMQAAHLTKEDRKTLAHLLSGSLTMQLVQRRPGDEFVTAGGVLTNEVNPKTMESKLCPGLYFAGEILDIDGVTGGFNLQSSWATGFVAGESIGESLRKIS